MVFTEPAFLFLYLPCLLACNFASPQNWRNVLLMFASLLFYGLGEPDFVAVLIASCIFNFVAALGVDAYRGTWVARLILFLAILANLTLLATFKYVDFANDILRSVPGLAALIPSESSKPWFNHLPLGVSFFTFHAISYVVDVYRGTNVAQQNPMNVVLYVTLFPQLIAGPIIRYHDVAEQLKDRTVGLNDFAEGISRFVIGLGKKMLIANTVAVGAETAFSTPQSHLTCLIAWFGIVCYTLQIYFDFSGYSDMAIGLGHMFGFTFRENFNYPYISGSITEFWRRWHISLSNWFRDYLYIPLGGNRVSSTRTYINLVVVFFLCGLWHGASANFIVWGTYHGMFLVLERLGLLSWLTRQTNPARHLYVMIVVMLGWVLFRSPDLAYATDYCLALAGYSLGTAPGIPLWRHVLRHILITIVIACVCSTPVIPATKRWVDRLNTERPSIARPVQVAIEAITLVALAGVFSVSVVLSAAGTYNPFIYYQF